MAERPKTEDASELDFKDDEGTEAPPPRRRRLVAIIAGAVTLVLALTGGGVALFGDAIGFGSGRDPDALVRKARERAVFYPLPDLVVSLDAEDTRAAFLKLRVTLELPEPDDQAAIERMLPRIIDFCQIYLRDLRVEDLRGSAGSMRLREELLRRIRAAVAPAKVDDVLFVDMLIH